MVPIDFFEDTVPSNGRGGLFPLRARSLRADWIRQLLPAELARRHLALPFQEVDGRLKVFLGDPENFEAAADLQLLSGCIVEAEPATPQILREAIRQVYQSDREWASIQVSEPASQPVLDSSARLLITGPAAWITLRQCFMHHDEALFQLPLPAGAVLHHFRVEAGSTVLAGRPPEAGLPGQTRLVEVDATGAVTARLAHLPEGPVWVEVGYAQLVCDDQLRLPVPIRSAVVEFEHSPVCLDCNRREVEVSFPPDGLRLEWNGPAEQELALGWRYSGCQLFCRDNHFLVARPGQHGSAELKDRGLNYLPESLVSSDGVLSGRFLTLGGLEVDAQLLLPRVSQNPAVSLLWAWQRPGGSDIARSYALLTPDSPFVLVDGEGPGGSLEAWDAPAGGEAEVNDSQLNQLVDMIVSEAIKLHASHIHVEPDSRGLRVRYRVHGTLHEIMAPPRSLQASLLACLKSIGGLDVEQNLIVQSGRGTIELDGQQWTLRIATLPTVQGEKLVIQLLPHRHRGLDDLGFSPDVQSRLHTFLKSPNGILLITGPRRAGKGTTLAALARAAVHPDRHLLWWDERGFPALEGATHLQPSAMLRADTLLSAIEEHDPEVLVWSRIHSQQLTRMANLASRQLVVTTWDQPWYPGLRGTLGTSHALMVLDQRLANCLCQGCHAAGCAACNYTGRGGQVSLAQVWEFAQGASHPLHITCSLHQQLGELVNHGRVSANECQRLSLGSSAPP